MHPAPWILRALLPVFSHHSLDCCTYSSEGNVNEETLAGVASLGTIGPVQTAATCLTPAGLNFLF